MAVETKIQWCDHTFNPWRGCTKVAAGCTNCYADAQAKRNPGVLGIWGDDGTRVVASESMWQQPIKWDAAAAGDGVRRRVFCASLADVFEDWRGPMVSHDEGRLFVNPDGDWMLTEFEVRRPPFGSRFVTMQDVRQRLFRLIDKTPHLDWLLLTKRPENIRRMWQTYFPGGYIPEAGAMNQEGPRHNVWLITSVANQADADRNIPHLLKCRDLSPVLGVSAEPLVGPVDFTTIAIPRDDDPKYVDMYLDSLKGRFPYRPELSNHGLDWVIVGGESGPRARPCHVEWIWSIVLSCRAAGVPCFVKQLGSHCVTSNVNMLDWPPGVRFVETNQVKGAAAARVMLDDLKGGDPSEWPEELRVRQRPMAREVV